MARPKMLGMKKTFVPNAKADMRFKKKVYQRGREIAERDPGESRAARREMKRLERMKADAVEMEEKGKYRPRFITSNAITLSDKIQLVCRFYGEVEEIHKNYDFAHCTCAWSSWNNEVFLPRKALECIINKELYYIGSKYPLCSIIRTRKFIARGYHINAGQYVKMCMQLNALDLADVRVLEDQLTGVDTTYFQMMIDSLRAHMEQLVPIRSTVGTPWSLSISCSDCAREEIMTALINYPGSKWGPMQCRMEGL